jgi:sugar/nucleoside kinase (ribokinase family)
VTSGQFAPADGPLVVVGDVVTDIVCRTEGPAAAWRPGTDTDASVAVRPGGSGANTAAWAARAAAGARRVTFAGRVGADDATWHGDALRAVGVDARLSIDPSVATTRLVALIDTTTGERTMLTDRGAGRCLDGADVDHAMNGAAWLHLSGYLLFAPAPRAVFEHLVVRCHAERIPWSVDPASAGYLRDLGVGEARRLLRGATIGFPNEDEARLLAGVGPHEPIESVAVALLALWPTVVVTCGAAGALVAHDGVVVASTAPAGPVDVVDAVGAGDAFAGAYLVAHLAGSPESLCLAAATAASALALATIGGRPASDA